MSNTSYRVKYDLNNPSDHLKFKFDRSVDLLQVLSLNITQRDAYKLYSSNYGVLVGRVLANDGFGIQNAKVSIFIKNENVDLYDDKNIIYPYESTSSKNNNNIRYNLLPSDNEKTCYQNVGTFPSKRRLLDNNSLIEVFDQYYKFTTVTNASGDYMIFGLPTGQHQLHVDIDLSDIGVLSQSPRDMEYKGYDIKQFESPNKFKKSTNLDSLPQIISENTDVYIYPFWGDQSESDVAISKKNINVRYKFEPTCVFMGGIFTDSVKNSISKSCKPSKNSGKMNELVTSQGTIEMIRVANDGSVEQFEVNGNRLIDENGVWCYQIPMNLDYVITDEYGNIKPTNNPEIGIPTRAKVRFRIKMDDNGDSFTQTRTACYLLPNNPKTTEEEDYSFDTNTKDTSFVDLMWNKVYSVKNYIPRFQKATLSSIFGINIKNRRFNGIKSTNNHESNSPIPYNNIWINVNLRFSLICMLTNLLLTVVRLVNDILLWIDRNSLPRITIPQIAVDTSIIGDCDNISEISERNLYVPNSNEPTKKIRELTASKHSGKIIAYEGFDTFYGSAFYFDKIIDCVETTLSKENDVINFDFTNDWLNGSLYAPRFYVKTKKNKKNGKLKNVYCGSYTINEYPNLNIVQTCAVGVSTGGTVDNNTENICTNQEKCYKKTKNVSLSKGCVMPNMGELAYYRSNEFGVDYIKYIQTSEVILLGSLNSVDLDGIPTLHRLLPSTTFKLPPDVVDEDVSGFFSETTYYNLTGYNYTLIDKYSAYSQLSGTTGSINELYYVLDDGNNVPAYYLWDNSTHFYAVTDQVNDPNEGIGRFAVATGSTWVQTGTTVEMSGIDWGDTTDTTSNGLFLGVTCMDSLTTIKSCINANRICELGVDLDENYSYDNGLVEVTNIVDGYISNEEISDGDARGMFATLNYNKLKTKNVNNFIKYDFNYIYPDGFDGRLKFEKTNDTISSDYFKFRFGDRYNDFKKSYYSYSDGEYTFPKYENSFYFYFGLKPGNTSLDIFNSRYFANCEQIERDAFNFKLTENKSETICPGFDGELLVNVSDVVYPYTILLDGVTYQTNIYTNEYLVSGLTSKYYDVTVVDSNENYVTKKIFLSSPKTVDFEYTSSPCSDNLSHNGTITITNIINENPTSNSYTYELRSSYSSVVNSGYTTGNTITFNGLSGDTYNLKLYQTSCSLNENNKDIIIAEPPTLGVLQVINEDLVHNTPRLLVGVVGNITSVGWPTNIVDSGFYWNETGEPFDLNKSVKVSNPINNFSAYITNLSEFTTYYIKAYVTNGYYTVYSDIITYTTSGMQ